MCGVQTCQGAAGVMADVLDVPNHVALLVVGGGLAPVQAHAPVSDEGLTGAVPAIRKGQSGFGDVLAKRSATHGVWQTSNLLAC